MEVLQLPHETSYAEIWGGFKKNAIRRLLNISNIWAFHRPMCDKDLAEEIEGVFKKARPARPQPLGRAERTEEYVSTTKRRPACALARRTYSAKVASAATKAGSASARRREAATAKAGNAAGLPAEAPAQARRAFSALPLGKWSVQGKQLP